MSKPKPPSTEAGERQKRLAAALRDNLKRRKAQARARTESPSEAGDSAAKRDNPPSKA